MVCHLFNANSFSKSIRSYCHLESSRTHLQWYSDGYTFWKCLLLIGLMRRTWDQIQHLIPLSQAAYQAGKPTTEQVYAVNSLAEKAITSNDYTVHIPMFNMSKVFTIVDGGKLFKMLHKTLLAKELHFLNLLLNDVSIKARVGKETGEEINILLFIMQGDCLRAILFICILFNPWHRIYLSSWTLIC